MHKRGGQQRGFTIVELLIVVVVIAILAAVTIVAYNGIRNRAGSSAMKSTVSQVGKKIQTYAVTNNGTVPSESTYASDLALPAATASSVYDYFTDSAQAKFCFSVTDPSQNVSFAYSTNGGLVDGRCVKNLISNPSLESLSGGNVVGLTASSRVTVSSSTLHAQSGARTALVVPTYTTTDTFADLANWGIQANTTYAISMRYTLTSATTSQPRFRFNIGGVDRQSLGTSAVGTHTNSWTFDVGASATVSFLRIMPGGLQGDPGIYVDNLMVTQTPVNYQYGDGDSVNWAWVGAPHASASFGPSLPL